MGIKNGIVKGLMSNNMQKSMKSKNKIIESEINVDYKLALYIYNYLNEKNNKLPIYEFIDSIFNNSEEKIINKLISSACGINVYLNKINGILYLKVESEEKITSVTSRVEIITAKKHEAVVTNPSFSELLNIDEFPRYSKKRVLVLQKYLTSYTLRKRVEEKSKSK